MPKGKQDIRIVKLRRRYVLAKVYYKDDSPDYWVFSTPEGLRTVKQILDYRRLLRRAVELPVLQQEDFNEYEGEIEL